MSKILLITDTHFGARNGNGFVQKHFEDFYKNHFFPHIAQNKFSRIIHLGDLFDNRKYINYKTLFYWINNFIKPLNDCNIPIDLIIGNHDTYNKSTNDINSPEVLLENFSNFRVYRECYENEKDSILYVPWINPENKDATKLAIQKSNCRTLMGHLEIQGFEMFRGNVNKDHGFDRADLGKFEAVYSGHFHHKSTQGNITYLGSPTEFTLGDYGSERGFHEFDPISVKLDFIPNPDKLFFKLVYNNELDVKQDFSHLTGKFIRLVVETKNDLFRYSNFLDTIEGLNPAQLDVIEAEFDFNGDEDEAVDMSKDTLTILNEYIDEITLEPTVDSSALKFLMNELYTESLALE